MVGSRLLKRTLGRMKFIKKWKKCKRIKYIFKPDISLQGRILKTQDSISEKIQSTKCCSCCWKRESKVNVFLYSHMVYYLYISIRQLNQEALAQIQVWVWCSDMTIFEKVGHRCYRIRLLINYKIYFYLYFIYIVKHFFI